MLRREERTAALFLLAEEFHRDLAIRGELLQAQAGTLVRADERGGVVEEHQDVGERFDFVTGDVKLFYERVHCRHHRVVIGRQIDRGRQRGDLESVDSVPDGVRCRLPSFGNGQLLDDRLDVVLDGASAVGEFRRDLPRPHRRGPPCLLGIQWRERMGVEPTRDDANRPATVLKFATPLSSGAGACH